MTDPALYNRAMLRAPLTSKTCRSRTTPALMVLQVAAAVLVPVLHARAESRNDGRAFETTHSSQCAVVHSEARCSFGASDDTIGAPARTISISAHIGMAARPSRAPGFTTSSPNPSANGIRAPPRH
jgi:hypothetical protein